MNGDVEGFRADFPGATNKRYFNVADRGLLSNRVRAALSSYVDLCVGGATKEGGVDWPERARGSFADLVHAARDEVALTKNVSDGINAVAHAVDWRRGDNVVLCDELEHPSNLVPWRNLADTQGVHVRRVRPVNWAIDPEEVISSLDTRTRAVSLSMVTFVPGFRTDLVAIGDACRSRGVLLIVDAAQAVGVIDVDLSRLPVDSLAVGTPKAMLGLYGMGFLYIRRSLIGALRPAYLSGAGVSRDSLTAGASYLQLKADASRFEIGNSNHLGCVAAATAIAQLLDVGMLAIERHACELAARLSSGLRELGLPVVEPPRDNQRSHIVSVGRKLDDQLDGTSDRQAIDLHDFLRGRNVELSIRRGLLRFSTHAYTNAEDVAEILDLCAQWKRSL